MADGSYIDQVLGWLKGNPATTTNLAPPLASYPSNSDAEFARKYGFSQGNEHQQYLDNEKARVLGLNMPDRMPFTKTPLPSPDPRRGQFVPASGAGLYADEAMNPAASKDVNPQETGLSGKLDNLMMRAGLAANRSPIAAVGFDPSKVVLDTQMKHGSMGGAYAPSLDTIYSTTSPDDSVVHESTHRGLQQLRQLYPDQAPKALKQLPDEETVVRWLMHSQGGDPEGGAGEVDAKQRQTGIDMFSGEKYPALAEMYKAPLNQLQELAIDAMKNRGKRVGPQ